MYDEYQTRQFWDNMKKSQLKHLIREEFISILKEALISKEQLPGYENLPDNRSGVNWNEIGNRLVIYVPSVDSDGRTGIFSKEDLEEYIEDFKKFHKEEPNFARSEEHTSELQSH